MDRRKRSRSRSRSPKKHYKHIEYSHKEHSKTRITYSSRSRSPDRYRSKRSPQRRYNDRRRSRTPPRYRSRSRSGYRSRSRSSSRRRHHNDRYRSRRSNSRSRSNERRQPREYNERYNERYNARDSHSQSTGDRNASSQGFMEIFKLLYEFRKEIIEYLNSAFESQVRPLEIFMRWYLNSLPNGAKDYFMPVSFTAQENDIDYYQHSMRPNITKQGIINSVQTIWEKYKNKRYFSKAGDKSYLITEDQERRLRNLYTGPEKDYDRLKNLLLAAYEFMGNMNNHLSVPPAIFAQQKIFELFGSPINTSQSYCSPFKLEQEYFGSMGSFFEYEIRGGLHIANPPFDETLMEQMADRLEAQLARREGVTVICIIPVWDPESQSKYGLKNFNKRFIAFEKLMGSKYFKENHYLGKEEYPFWNYYKKAYIPASHSHFIVLSNATELPFKSQEVIEQWKRLK